MSAGVALLTGLLSGATGAANVASNAASFDIVIAASRAMVRTGAGLHERLANGSVAALEIRAPDLVDVTIPADLYIDTENITDLSTEDFLRSLVALSDPPVLPSGLTILPIGVSPSAGGRLTSTGSAALTPERLALREFEQGGTLDSQSAMMLASTGGAPAVTGIVTAGNARTRMAFMVSEVPEPSTALILAAGLGVVGWRLRRSAAGR